MTSSGIHDFDVVVRLDVARRHRAGALLVKTQFRAVTRMHAQRDLLEVEQDVDDIFLHTLDARVLMQHAVDLDFRDRTAGHGGKQYATQRVAERVAEAPLERLDHDARLPRCERLYLHDARLQKFSHGTLHGSSPRRSKPA